MELAETSLTKEEIIARIKELKAKGSSSTVRLNSPGRILLIELQTLVKRGPKDPGWTIHDDLWLLLLKRLTLNTIYRLYQFCSAVRRVVDAPTRTLWRELIMREYGIIPQFKVDLKGHYLRMFGTAVAGNCYTQQYPFTWIKISSSVIRCYKEKDTSAAVLVFPSRKIFRGQQLVFTLEKGEQVIFHRGEIMLTDHKRQLNVGTKNSEERLDQRRINVSRWTYLSYGGSEDRYLTFIDRGISTFALRETGELIYNNQPANTDPTTVIYLNDWGYIENDSVRLFVDKEEIRYPVQQSILQLHRNLYLGTDLKLHPLIAEDQPHLVVSPSNIIDFDYYLLRLLQ